MPSPNKGLTPGQTPSTALPFWTRVHRYRCLLGKYWWILALTLSIAICAAAAYEMTRPPTFMSVSSLTVDTENKPTTIGGNNQGDSPWHQELEDFMMTQVDVIKGTEVTNLAALKLRAQYPGETTSPVLLDVLARNNLLTVTATGTNRAHTQHYLEARIRAYLEYRQSLRGDSTNQTLEIINNQIKETNVKLQKDDDAKIAFQREHNIYLGNGDTSANGSTPLANLKQKLAVLRDQQDQLQAMSPEQVLEHPESFRTGGSPAAANGADSAQERSGLETSSAEAEYRQAQADLAKLKAQMDDLSRDLRPAHPKIIALHAAIKSDQEVIANLLQQNKTRIDDQKALVKDMIATTEHDIALAEPKALDTDLLRAQYDALVEQKQRDLKTYEDLQNTWRNASLNKQIDKDKVQLTEAASPAQPVPSGWLKALAVAILGGLLSGLGLLWLIDQMDDRMGSISDFQQHFAEQVIGQIPRDPTPGNTELLRPDDERHMLVESFRNLRSTLLFMPLDGSRPKTLLVTSAIPNEGKSTVSSNLALVLAFAGMKTLLIDADLRRGAIHKAFGLSRDPGLTDVLRHNVKWESAVRTTGVENLHILPRGRNVPQPSEYLLGPSTDLLLRDLYDHYDYIIIDSSPILAADDTASLAPKIDATLFVVRLSFTPAKLTRKSLEVLYNRQANIPGLILNQVDTSSPEFVYYQYSEYYGVATDHDGDDDPPVSLAKSKAVAKAV
jgi:succinoglycan biosynthesis transport protein ExoP